MSSEQSSQQQPSTSTTTLVEQSSDNNKPGFFDKFVAKIKKLSSDENPAASFDEIIPVSGLLGSTSKFSLSSATDLQRLIGEVSSSSHCAPNGEMQKIFDETFFEIAEIVKLIEVTISNERFNLQRAQYCRDLAKPVTDAVKKELAAVEHFLQLNLRVKITKGEKKDAASPPSIHVEVFKKWTDHSETCAQKLEKIEEERKKWDDIIARLEKGSLVN
jgi:hypothetical protein